MRERLARWSDTGEPMWERSAAEICSVGHESQLIRCNEEVKGLDALACGCVPEQGGLWPLPCTSPQTPRDSPTDESGTRTRCSAAGNSIANASIGGRK